MDRKFIINVSLVDVGSQINIFEVKKAKHSKESSLGGKLQLTLFTINRLSNGCICKIGQEDHRMRNELKDVG